jgi:hypothetical protein
MYKVFTFTLMTIMLLSCTGTHENVDKTARQSPDTTDMTNNFYDNTETISLPVNEIIIDGEISNPSMINLKSLPLHSVIVKEALLDSTGGDRFVGAYRYDGYSLFDILNERIIDKVNKEEFNPIIDLYVEVTGKKGEKVVFSWGEIYYPNNLHKIIIAGSVSRIVPSKTKDLWPLPSVSKIVAATDLVTERNISEPVKITVRSVRKSLKVVKGLSPMYSKNITILENGKKIGSTTPSEEDELITFNTIFYGRGKGIHSTSPFSGILLKDVLLDYYVSNRKNLREGIICISGEDGYRSAISFSELCNRNDQQEFLLVTTEPGEDGGLFRIFAAADFFSDRAIKSVKEVDLMR